jgi:hypothetical protein
MAAQVSFWQRMSSMFRADASLRGGNGPVAVVEPAAGGDGKAGVGQRSSLSLPQPAFQTPVGPWWRRSARRAQAREVSLRVVELAQAMQQHFRQQDQRAAELTGSLNRLGGILEQLSEAQRTQGDGLRAIAEHTEAARQDAATLTAALGRMPESLVAQAEAIRTVARHLEISQESDTQLMHSMQQFGRVVDSLGSAGSAQVEVLGRLNAAQREQHQALTALVREQSRRFLLIMGIVALLMLGALAALTVTLALNLRL